MTDRVLTLMAIHAHPDDEAFSMGGTFAKAANAGIRTVLVCATRGEVGEIHDPDLDPEEAKERLGAIREEELRRACAILKISHLEFLGYRDSGMVGTADNADPRNFHNADPEEATEKVVRLIRQYRPQVVVTYDAKGGYGHPDHIKAHQVTVAAVEAASDASRYPRQERLPWQVAKLYYTAFPRSLFRHMQEEMQKRNIPNPFPDRDWKPEEFTTPDELVTTQVDIRAYLREKREALRVHRTQIAADNFILTMADDAMAEGFGNESFTRVLSAVATPDHEDDLFAGLSGQGFP